MANTTLTLLSHERLIEAYEQGYWRDDTIYTLLKLHAATAPDRVAICDAAGEISYGELLACVESFAAELERAGVRRGQRVAVWLSSRIETAIAFLACSRNGYACSPSLHRDHTTGDVIDLLQRMRAAAFVGEEGYGADASRHDIFRRLEEVDTLRKIVKLGRVQAGASNELLISSGREPASPPNSDPNLLVYLAFTSGTTGLPKGVMHSDNTLLANARAMIADWSFDESLVIYTMSPLSHNLGIGSLIMGLAAGGKVVVHGVQKGASTLERILDVGATFIVGVPTHAIDLLTEIRARGLQAAGRIKGFRISGASAPREVVSELLQHGITPQSGYGMTEAGSHHYTRSDDTPARIVETSGRACDCYEVSIWSIDDQDRRVAAGEEGQIGGRGASLMLGYFDDQLANETAFNKEGWFMTGDVGRMDEDGYLTITGRKKDLIIRGGHNIYPAKIENLAMQHPAVLHAAAIPVADVRLGEKVCIVVAARPGADIEADELLAHLDRSGLSRYDMPEYFLKLDRIPLTASGKVLKRALLSQVSEGAVVPRPIRFAPAAMA